MTPGLLLSGLLAPPAAATGLPPWEAVVVVDADCQPTQEIDRELAITFSRWTGVCAPRPDGDPCSTQLLAELPATSLVVRRSDCDEPQPGHFVPDGRCGEHPRWRFQGRLDPGHDHDIGPDFAGSMARVHVAGAARGPDCPAASKRSHETRTAVRVTRDSAPVWIAFPADGYGVAGHGDDAALTWTPGPTLRQWVLQDDDVVLRSAPLSADAARALLDGALREPGGIAVRHRTAEYREWFEGWRQRGVQRCERVLEMDLEQRIRPREGEELGPPMTATVRLRDSATADQCRVEEASGD